MKYPDVIRLTPNGPGYIRHDLVATVNKSTADRIDYESRVVVDFTEPEGVVMTDPLKPNAGLLCKLGSIAVHVDEAASDTGHAFDKVALKGLIDDPEVAEWLVEMDKMALIPKKR